MVAVSSKAKPPRQRQVPVPEVRDAEPFLWQGVLIFVVAILVRLIHLWQIRDAPFFSILMGDARVYDQWALEIARGDWIGQTVFYQAPLYPYFLGTLYAIAGRHLFLV